MKTKTYFLRSIRKCIKTDPAGMLRWDLPKAESAAFGAAFGEVGLTAPGINQIGKVFFHYKHADPDHRDAGLIRCAYFGPDHPDPTGASAYTPQELYAAQNKSRLDAEKPKRQCRENSAKGGKATAHFTDAEIISAFAAFKAKHPRKTAWYAAEMLTRPGGALSRSDGRRGYKGAQGAYKKLGRIAKSQQEFTAQEFYEFDV